LSREADLSTEQTRAQAPPRLSRAHADGRRPQGAERAPRARPQAPVGLTAICAASAPRPPRSHAAEAEGQAAGDSLGWGRLTRRAEFQWAAKGRRAQREAFALQANRRPEPAAVVGPRVGFTVTKKLGNAVVRNRIRRRLREALRRVSRLEALPDHDYVLMARLAALTMDFEALVGEIDRGFRQLRRDGSRSGPRGQK
jgi:ribonuclease P protein component